MIGALWSALAPAAPLTVAAPGEAPAVGQHVQLSFSDEAMRCALPGAAVVAAHEPPGVVLELGVLEHAWAGWLQDRGTIGLAEPGLGPCSGIPEPFVVHVPPQGRALQVRDPIAALEADPGVTAIVGPDPSWIVVWPPAGGAAAVAVHHSDGPPTPFEVRRAAPVPPGITLRIPVGGAVALPGSSGWLALPEHEGIEVRTFAGQTLLLGRAEVSLAGFTGDARPEPFGITVGGGWGAAPSEPLLSVGMGRTRRFRTDQPISEVLVVSPEIARVALRPSGLKIEGLAPGQTRVALSDGATLHWVRVVVP